MGQHAVKTDGIDETFAGLVSPVETISVGRPDLETGRPGELLVEAVRAFDAEGGFRDITKARANEREEQAALDRGVVKDRLPDFGKVLDGGSANGKDFQKSDD